MYCGNCGSQIQDGSPTCPVCGAPQRVQQPAPRPAPPEPVPPVGSGRAGTSESGWGLGLRIFGWFLFIAIILSSVVAGIRFFDQTNEPLFLVACIVGGFLVAFFTVASLMVRLNQARDTAEIRDLLRQINSKSN